MTSQTYTDVVPAAKRAGAGNLPAESTTFVGRRRLLVEVKAAFERTRLLTLVGPGGVGKTRLALRAAVDLRRTISDGVWFVDLAGLQDPHLVAKAAITSLGVADRSGLWPTSLLVTHLASREALLILDNCEHLLDAIAVLADVILKEAGGVRILATSRQPLGISCERVLQVAPLTLPEEASSDPGQGFAPSEAVALFLARASDAGIQQLGPVIKFQNQADLLILKELIEAGKVTPVIDGTYPLSRTPEALGHVAEGHARGTVVVTVLGSEVVTG